MADREQERKNREIVAALQETLSAMVPRLTPEVEPAVIYIIEDAAR